MIAQRPRGCRSLEEAAEKLARRGYCTDSRRIGAQLRELGLMEGGHASKQAINEEMLDETRGTFTHGGGGSDYYSRVWVTGKGMARLYRSIPYFKPHCDVDLGMPKKCELGF